MNFTDEYIEMVSVSDEIQKYCKYEMGDCFRYKDSEPYILEYKPNQTDIDNIRRYNLKWLPTLEQLFEMLQGSCCIDKLDDFYHWVITYPYTTINIKFVDLKVYLLVYLMEKNYKKMWNGIGWEDIKNE
jgi:NADPH-dependent 7-cyano-7-deazaguanine reductase QueF